MDFLYNPWVMFGLFVLAIVAGGIWGAKKRGKKSEDGNTMQLNVGVVAVVVAVALLFSLPTLSIDIEGIFTYAFDIVNAFMPLIAIIAGLGLGFNLVTKIGSLFQRAL